MGHPLHPGPYLQINPLDNAGVALQDLPEGLTVETTNGAITLQTPVAAKHKFALEHLQEGADIRMYGVLVGRALCLIRQGEALTVDNIIHAAAAYHTTAQRTAWVPPGTGAYEQQTFMGFHRADGSVGTSNYWLIIPLVFCENRNVEVLKEALNSKLGFQQARSYENEVEQLVSLYRAGHSAEEILQADLHPSAVTPSAGSLFPHIDGIRFLTHELGCGGTRQDAEALCGLLAGYITHPNVAGATVLSLGCQHAQAAILTAEVYKRDPSFNKPMIVLEQQQLGTERRLLEEALRQTFAGLMQVSSLKREPAPLSKLCIGLECGGSDGFSGISANPVLGYVSDMLVALGGTVILSEFPELCGVEQELSDRCTDQLAASRFIALMERYNRLAEASGSGFYANPSPGNIKDGLITDAIKSAGAARKGGSSPVVAVLDYPEKVTCPGLNLLCTPGSDVESTTAEVGAGANLVLFTTGLGTPTGNPVAPVIKISTNTSLFRQMHDIIDFDCGTIITGSETIPAAGDRLLRYILAVASGLARPRAVELGQNDFIPWKRGVSL